MASVQSSMPRVERLTDEQKQVVRQLYEAGSSCDAIARQLRPDVPGLSHEHVRRTLLALGVKMRARAQAAGAGAMAKAEAKK